MKRILAIISVMLIFSSSVFAQKLEDIVWITEEYAPYNYSVDGIPTGIVVDVLVEMWKKLGLNKTVSDIKVQPWARAYRTVQDELGYCLFSMTVTAPRKEIFAFVEPIIDLNQSIIAKKSKNYRFKSVEDFKNLRLGVIRDDVGEQLIVQAGFPDGNIHRANQAANLVQILDRDRIDAIAYGFNTAGWNMRQFGIDVNKYEIVYTLTEAGAGFAFHKNTDKALLARIQKSLDDVKKEGIVDRIIKSYLE